MRTYYCFAGCGGKLKAEHGEVLEPLPTLSQGGDIVDLGAADVQVLQVGQVFHHQVLHTIHNQWKCLTDR